jgi:Fe2+ transport system protein FeoA
VPTRPLAEVPVGERVRLVRISEELETNLDLLALLDGGQFIPGAVARVGGRDPDGSIEVTVEGATVSLRVPRPLSDRLYVGTP